MPREDIEAQVPIVVREPAEERVVVEEQPVQQGVLTLGFRTGVRYPDDDYAALQVYNGVLGSFPAFEAVYQRAGAGESRVFRVVAAGRDERHSYRDGRHRGRQV